ncbi:MAG: Cys-Gln thioester bond-forming surface protein [Clostridia bacterium]
MKKKRFCIIIAVMAIVAFLLSYIISYANTSETIYVNLTKLDTNGIGYGIGNPTTANEPGQPATNAYIWNITTYNSNNVNDISNTQRNLYCIKANYGDSWNTNKDTIVGYKLSYDLQSDRKNLLDKIVDNGKDVNDILKTLLSESGYYRELLWILDNAYIKGQTDKKEFLSSIGINYDSTEKAYYYTPIEGYDYSALASANGYTEANLITDEDIKAVQRAVIWYYTNYLTDTTNDAVFNQKSKTDWLTITSDGTTYKQLADFNKFEETENGPLRNEQAQILYNYLVDAASKNASKYTEENNYTITKGVTVNTTGLTQNSNGKYRLSATRVDSNYVVGPIIIDKNDSLADGISITVTNQDNSDIQYTFTDREEILFKQLT